MAKQRDRLFSEYPDVVSVDQMYEFAREAN